jgi:ABC-type antimicrobial peptide transport system permease subunit
LGSADVVLRDVIREVRAIGEPVGAIRATTFDTALDDLLKARRFDAWSYGAFATASIVILAAGLLGLVAMTTAARTREIGVRSALGASPRRLARHLVREQIWPVATGIGLGLLLTWWAAGAVRLSLYGFTKTDWRLWTIASGIVLAASLLGALIPAFRASRVDPVRALRVE